MECMREIGCIVRGEGTFRHAHTRHVTFTGEIKDEQKRKTAVMSGGHLLTPHA